VNHKLMVVLIVALLLLCVGPAGAQGVVNVSIDDLNFEQFPQIRTLITVRNENGVPLVGLGPDKFEIIEDGRASFPPAEVSAHVNPDADISVVLVIDVSGSMKGKPISGAMQAANAFLDQLSAEDRVAVIAFADRINVDPEQLDPERELAFTTDKNAARNIVNFLDTKLGWDTPLYDAIYKGVKMVSTEPAGKRAVIVMTDGKDERDNAQGVAVKDAGSTSTPDDPILEANRHNIPIFSIGLGTKIDTKYLTRLAERTGGVYQQTPEAEELTGLFENVLNQLKQQYTLTYNSTLPQDAIYHSLLIRVQLPQGQSYDETKFQFVQESAPIPPAEEQTPVSPSGEPTVAIVAQVNPTPPPAIGTNPEPEPAGVGGIADRVKEIIEEKPLLAAAIGGGALLLLILIIALIIVLMKGRGAEEEEFATAGYDQSYSAPPPSWGESATTPGTPAVDAGGGRTEVAPSDWPSSGGGDSVGPLPGSQPAGVGMAGGFAGGDAPAGGTRIIERAPKHLAMLVEKARPDRKYDLKGTVNVGRARESQVCLDDVTVSRQHAWIKAEGEDFLVFDIGSANGTFVNDERIDAPRRLENGDVVRFGEVELVFTRVF